MGAETVQVVPGQPTPSNPGHAAPGAPLAPGAGADPTPPAGSTTAAPPPGDQGIQFPVSRDGKTVVLPQSAFKRIKEEEAKKAERRLAKEAGFDNVDDFRRWMKDARSGGGRGRPAATPEVEPEPTTPPAATAQPNGKQPTRKEQAQLDREREKLRRENETLRRQVAAEGRARRETQRHKDALEAQIELERAAAQEGVKDVDFAIRLLTREMDGKTEEQLNGFDERAFFRDLRKTRPYLFEERVVPANTGLPGADTPPAPDPSRVNRDDAATRKVDVRRMSKEEYNAYMRKNKLRVYG